MKGLIIFVIVTAVLLIIGIPLVLGLGIRYIPGGNQPADDQPIAVDSKNTLTQTFTATRDNLVEVGISIRNYNLLNKDPFTFELSENGNVVRTVNITGANVQDGEFVKFKFVPIADSKDKTYQITLKASATKDNPTRPFIANTNSENGGILALNGSQINGELSFVPFYRVGNLITFPINLYANLFAQLAKDPIFAGVFTIITLLSFGLLLFA